MRLKSASNSLDIGVFCVAITIISLLLEQFTVNECFAICLVNNGSILVMFMAECLWVLEFVFV